MRERFDPLADTLRAQGVRGLFVKVLDVVGLYRRMTLLGVPLVSLPPRPSAFASRIVARTLDPSQQDLVNYVCLRPETSVAAVRARLDAGAICFVTLLDGAMVAAMWAIKERAHIDYLGCDIQLGCDEGYVFDAFTQPALRGHDLAAWSGERMRRHMTDLGCRRIVSAHLPENASAVTRAARRGEVRLGTIGVLGIGRFRRPFVRLEPAKAAGEPLPHVVLRPCRRARGSDRWCEF